MTNSLQKQTETQPKQIPLNSVKWLANTCPGPYLPACKLCTDAAFGASRQVLFQLRYTGGVQKPRRMGSPERKRRMGGEEKKRCAGRINTIFACSHRHLSHTEADSIVKRMAGRWSCEEVLAGVITVVCSLALPAQRCFMC